MTKWWKPFHIQRSYMELVQFRVPVGFGTPFQTPKNELASLSKVRQ